MKMYRAVPIGNVFLGTVTHDSCSYVARYVQKKRHKDHPSLQGRLAEFSSMSGGLGRDFMWDMASAVLSDRRLEYAADVPSTIRYQGKNWPLSRYLRQKLREYLGRGIKTPQEILDQMAEEMRPLREAAFNNSRSFKKEVIAAADQRVLNMEARANIFKERYKL